VSNRFSGRCTNINRPSFHRAINDSSFYPPDNSFQIHRTSRSQPTNPIPIQTVSRPLSSADEAGPVTKKLRSTSQHPETLKTKASKSSLDDPLKKARARPALSFANIFSSSGRRSQSTTSSRTNVAPGKSNTQPAAGHIPTRRSTRLLSGTAQKPPSSKVILIPLNCFSQLNVKCDRRSNLIVVSNSIPPATDDDNQHTHGIDPQNRIKMKCRHFLLER